jgi:hypothetical protein
MVDAQNKAARGRRRQCQWQNKQQYQKMAPRGVVPRSLLILLARRRAASRNLLILLNILPPARRPRAARAPPAHRFVLCIHHYSIRLRYKLNPINAYSQKNRADNAQMETLM